MKKVGSWYFPDHERHLIDWMANPKGHLVLNGRESYQGKKQALALAHVPQDRRRVAIDIGGHIGLWSFNLMHGFDTVHAFEPVAAHRECFGLNVNGPHASKVTLHPCALGDREGSVSISTEDGSSGNSFVKGKGDVPMHTLDSFGFENVDFVKIDTEGYETFILKGGEEMINRWHPTIIVEQKRDMSATRFGLPALSAVKYLISLGYKVVADQSGDYVMVHP